MTTKPKAAKAAKPAAKPASAPAPKPSATPGLKVEHVTTGVTVSAPAPRIAGLLPAPAGNGAGKPEPAKAKQVDVGPVQSLTLSAERLAAALVCAAPEKENARPYLAGVYLHRRGDTLRLVATNGSTMLVQSIPLTEASRKCEWLADGGEGLLLPRATLEPAVKVLPKFNDDGVVVIDYGKNQPRVIVRNPQETVTFRIEPGNAKQFPDYERIFAGAAATVASAETNPAEVQAIDWKYVAHTAKVAQLLDAKAVHTFAGIGNAPSVATFAGLPGALMVIMPMTVQGHAIAHETAAVLGKPLAASVAALKAHVTRREEAAKATKDEKERAKLQAAAEALRQRIRELVNSASGKALPAPKPAPAKKPAPAVPVPPLPRLTTSAEKRLAQAAKA